jgi:hypothetical protein
MNSPVVPVSNADLAAFIVALTKLREVVGAEQSTATFHEHCKPALWACCDEVKRRIAAGVAP